MTPERHQQIGFLFDEALERAPEERVAWLKLACGEDADLRVAVEQLLAHHDDAEEFLSRPALDVAAVQLARNQPPALIGQMIGRYRILSLLGVGGMGEVWLAHDSQLERKVALKLLPPQFTQNPDRLQRFYREARAASALNHPNILTIYDIGAADDLHFIATEYIDGVTLRQRLAASHLDLRETVAIIQQVAEALDTAHQADIIHRDIKPENVMLRRDGLVKVLDFGLAKLTETRSAERGTMNEKIEASSLHRSSFRDHPSITSGLVMGTPRYMSPEQARGLPVDARTDVFSLGLVFYEMVTGQPGFAGDTTEEVMAALRDKQPPPLREFVADVPDRLQEIVSRMLSKEREHRYPCIRDCLTELAQSELNIASNSQSPTAWQFAARGGTETLSQGNGKVTQETATSTQSLARLWYMRRRAWFVLAFLLALSLSIGLYRWFAPRHVPAVEAHFLPLIGEGGTLDNGAISPDESRLAFAWSGGKSIEVSPHNIYIKLIGTDAPPLRLTTGPDDDTYPCWTPDGKAVTFVRRPLNNNKAEVMRVSASSGPAQKLAETSTSADWSPDGKTLAVGGWTGNAEGKGILLLSPETGQRTRLTTPPAPKLDGYPRFSLDGKLLAFTRNFGTDETEILLVPAGGGEPRSLIVEKTKVTHLAWTRDGSEIVYSANNRGLWRISAQGGAPAVVRVNGQRPTNPDISKSGNKLLWTESLNDSDLWSYQSAGFAGRSVPGKFSAPQKFRASSNYEEHSPAFSPDGKKLLYVSLRSGATNLWMSDADGNNQVRLSLPGELQGSPRWSDDGQWIAYDAHADGIGTIYIASATGNNPARRLTFDKSQNSQPAWSHDGQWIYFKSNRSGSYQIYNSYQIYKMPVAGGEAKQLTFNGGLEGFESPDGKLFYYTKARGEFGIYTVPVNGGEEKLVPELSRAGYWRSWTMVPAGICFTTKENDGQPEIRFFSFATRRITPLLKLRDEPLWWTAGLALSPDGSQLLFAHLEHTFAEIMLMENFR